MFWAVVLCQELGYAPGTNDKEKRPSSQGAPSPAEEVDMSTDKFVGREISSIIGLWTNSCGHTEETIMEGLASKKEGGI